MEKPSSHPQTMALMGVFSGPQFPILCQRKSHRCPPVTGWKSDKHSLSVSHVDFQVPCLDGTPRLCVLPVGQCWPRRDGQGVAVWDKELAWALGPICQHLLCDFQNEMFPHL